MRGVLLRCFMLLRLLRSLAPREWILWGGSVFLVVLFFLLFDRENYLNLATTLIGVTALIFCAKGHPIGALFSAAFCILYGVISLLFSYYGEMLTYFCMSLPMAILSFVAWLRNPAREGDPEVKIERLTKKKVLIVLLSTVAVTVAFYFLLDVLGTNNLPVSTFSVATSFLAASLTFFRSPYYALAYTANNLVLVTLWGMESVENPSCLSVVACFLAFLANDLYGFYNWKKMQRLQNAENVTKS